jgi:hypothetical protein
MRALWVATCVLFLFANPADAQQSFNVASADEVESLIESGKLSAGDAIVWTAGTYRDVELDLVGVDCTQDQPITLQAENPGSVVLKGESQFKVGAQHWVIKGFHFCGVGGETNAYNAFQFRSNGGRSAQNVTLTDCAFTNLKTGNETSKWVLVYGRSNVIDRCHFSGKDSKGALVTVELGYLDIDETAEHRFTRNYFGKFSPQRGTDNETIRIGSSEDQNKPARCFVAENYFVACDGENEIISSKSSYNVFERNTFRQCNGALVLRHGHHARVEGNYFFGDGAKDSGGIRVVDSHHLIVNNYMQDLTGMNWNAAFSILGGKQTSGRNGNGYQSVCGIMVMHNSILNCNRSFLLNDAKGSKAPAGIVANNLIVSLSGPLVTEEMSGAKLQWVGNLMHGATIGAGVNAIERDPELKMSRGLLRPDPDGAAADAAVTCDVKTSTDIDGQSRPKSKADIGADEVSGAIGEASSRPLVPADVGVSFLRGEGPSKS